MALILVADDDELVVELVRETLERQGHVVGAVDDGFRVAGIVEFKQPALVILDCMMPKLPGVEALRQIRSLKVNFATPVLMLTARRNRADEQIAFHAGADDYLLKPFDPDQLLFRVEHLLARAAERRPQAVPAWRH